MSAFRREWNYFSYYGRGGNDPVIEQALLKSLQSLRMDFIYYRRHRRLDDFKGVDPKVTQAYNSLLWSINLKKKRKNQFVTRTVEEYFAIRKALFSTYYEAISKRKIDYSMRYFFDGLDDIELDQVRHTLKKNEVVYKLKIEAPTQGQIVLIERLGIYSKVYVEFCLKHNCQSDGMIKKIAPDKLNYWDYHDTITLIKILDESPNLVYAKNKLKKRYGYKIR